MPNSAPPRIEPSWTLAQLQAECPGIELTLFSHFGIGSRERSGFSGSEKLHDLLRRHLVFDAERACNKLTELATEDWRHTVQCDELETLLVQNSAVVIDTRSTDEFKRCRIANSHLLSQESVQMLRQNPAKQVVIVCRDGTQSPAASRLLRKQGFKATHLAGGLEAWSHEVDPTLPVLYPLEERGGHWYVLADDETLRYRFNSARSDDKCRILKSSDLAEFEEGRELLKRFPELLLVAVSATCFAVRGVGDNLGPAIDYLQPEVLAAECWWSHGQLSSQTEERSLLEKTLAEEAPKILSSHKGTVSVESYQNRILSLALGGGCAGCASANITTKRELAAGLYRAVPVLDGIRSV